MNSLWGKFAQKWIDTNYSIKSESDVDFDEEKAYKIWDTEYMLIKQHKESEYSSKPIQNGVFTLSWARHHMKKEDYMNMKDSLIGGRCISVNGIYENILCLDVKSLYPAAMALIIFF